MANISLQKAKIAKNDEFYTQLSDIDKELRHYGRHFDGKTVYCNCDDFYTSNFINYFVLHFDDLKLKKLVATGFPVSDEGKGKSYVFMLGKGTGRKMELVENRCDNAFPAGDFRNGRSLALLEEADIVVTNPPFSLARKYLDVLFKYGRKFLLVGDLNWLTYSNVFPLVKENMVWTGYNHIKDFVRPDGTCRKFGNKLWITNLGRPERENALVLRKRFDPSSYQRYDNYDAVEVGKVNDIPYDYDGVMGVPVTFLERFDAGRFEIVGATESEGKGFSNGLWKGGTKQALVDGRRVYKRIFVKLKQK